MDKRTTSSEDLSKKLQEFKVRDLSEKRDIYRIPVYWARIRVDREKTASGHKMILGTEHGYPIFFGFCMLQRRLFTVNIVGHVFVPLLTSDLYIKEDRCEERRRCLNLRCPLNCTTKASFLTWNGVPQKEWVKIKWKSWTSLGSLTWEKAEQVAEVVLSGEKKET